MKLHLSRQKFIAAYVQALVDRGNVQSQEVAKSLNQQVDDASNQRRIERFLAEVSFPPKPVLLLLMALLPKGKLHLSLDRTEWDFGNRQWNVLMLTAYSQGVGLPLWWSLLDNNSGNSNTQDRIKLLEPVLALLGAERIGSLCADREFIGREWYKWLLENRIRFYLRLPKSHLIQVGPYRLKPERILGERSKAWLDNIQIAGFSLSIALKRVVDTQGEVDILVVLTNSFAYSGTGFYQRRWSVECFFEGVKGRGFHLESTHLKEPSRLHTLLVLVSLAFATCERVGQLSHKRGHAIGLKKHGYKANSYFRHGKDLMGEAFRKGKLVIEQWLAFFYLRLLRQLIKLHSITSFVG